MPTADRLALAARLRQPPARATEEPVALLSIKPHYAHLIATGQKTVEFRRRFPKHFTAGQAIFYVTSPTRAIALVARIVDVHRAAPNELWRLHSPAGGTRRADLDEYFTNATAGVALLLVDVRHVAPPIALGDPRLAAIDFRPPQSSIILPADSALAALVL